MAQDQSSPEIDGAQVERDRSEEAPVDGGRIADLAALEARYAAPVGASLIKELDHVSAHYRALIEASPYVVLSTMAEDGVDASPRGDPGGVVAVASEKLLLLPDRRGNNRIDSLRNILRDPRVGLLFLIPGVGETIRVRGRAEISAAPALLERFVMQGKTPATVIKIHVERAYFQCQKATARSRIWDPAAQVERKSLPSAGQILEALSTDDFDGGAYDAAYPERMKRTIY